MMIGDKARGEIIKNTPTLGDLTCARIDLRSVPLKKEYENVLTNPHIMITSLNWYIAYSPTGDPVGRKYYNKDYYIELNHRQRMGVIRFGTLEEYKELVKKDERLQFLERWGEPITQELLDILRDGCGLQIGLFPPSKLIAYRNYLKQLVKEQSGEDQDFDFFNTPETREMYIQSAEIKRQAKLERRELNKLHIKEYRRNRLK